MVRVLSMFCLLCVALSDPPTWKEKVGAALGEVRQVVSAIPIPFRKAWDAMPWRRRAEEEEENPLDSEILMGMSDESPEMLLLMEEIEQVENLIVLQQHKLSVLREVRRRVQDGEILPNGMPPVDSEEAEDILDRDWTKPGPKDLTPAKRRGRGGAGGASPMAPPDAPLTMVGTLVRTGEVKDTRSVVSEHMLTFKTRPSAKDVRKARGSGTPPYGTANFVATVHSGGLVKFHNTHGELTSELRVPGEVRLLELESADEPTIALALSGGDVMVYNATLWENGRVVAGRRPRGDGAAARRPASEDPHGFALDLRLQYSFKPYGRREVTAMAFYLQRSVGKTLLLGNAAGQIGQYYHNGTLGGSVELPRPVTHFRRQGSLLAAVQGDSVRFVNIPRLSVTDLTCTSPSPDLRIRDVSFDALKSGMMFANTEGGTVLHFFTKKKVGDNTYCEVVEKIGPQGAGSSSVAALKGYVLHARDNMVTVYNTSDVRSGERVDLAGSFEPCDGNRVAAILASRASHHRSSKPGVVAVVCEGPDRRKSVTLYDSLLRFQYSTEDISWLRMPIMIGGALIVIAYQFFFRTSSSWAKGRRASRRDLQDFHDARSNGRGTPRGPDANGVRETLRALKAESPYY